MRSSSRPATRAGKEATAALRKIVAAETGARERRDPAARGRRGAQRRAEDRGPAAAIDADTLEAERERLRREADGAKDEIRKQRDEIERPQAAHDAVGETEFRDLDETYGSGSRGGRIFQAGMGAEAVRDIIGRMDLDELAAALHVEVRTTSPASAARRRSSGCAWSRRSAGPAHARSG